jgi:hypothetical protein
LLKRPTIFLFLSYRVVDQRFCTTLVNSNGDNYGLRARSKVRPACICSMPRY